MLYKFGSNQSIKDYFNYEVTDGGKATFKKMLNFE